MLKLFKGGWINIIIYCSENDSTDIVPSLLLLLQLWCGLATLIELEWLLKLYSLVQCVMSCCVFVSQTLQAKKVIPCPSFYSQDHPVKGTTAQIYCVHVKDVMSVLISLTDAFMSCHVIYIYEMSVTTTLNPDFGFWFGIDHNETVLLLLWPINNIIAI